MGDVSLNQELRQLRERVARLESEAEKRSLDGLHASEERFRLMADAAPVMMWMSGSDALCVFFNKPWLDFRGRSMQEEMGNGWAEGVHPEDVERCVNTYLEAFKKRESFRMDYRLRRYDGEYRWIADTGVPRYELDGSFAGYIGSCVELAETRRPAEEPVRRLTPREQQVLKLVAEGKSTKEIAVLLGISYKTADSHRSKIMEKLNVHETASLVRYAIRIGLVEP